jgi:uncharacterized membrane protein YjjB (DUF3815 family)
LDNLLTRKKELALFQMLKEELNMKSLFSWNTPLLKLMVMMGCLGFVSNTYAVSYPVSVPEPGTFALTALGAMGVLLSRFRNK